MNDTGTNDANVEIRDPAFRTVVGDTVAIEQIATGFLFTEGPLWHAREKYLLFSDMPGDHMRKWTARGGVTTFRKPCAQSNGLTWDRQGRLLVCEHATSKVTRTEADGQQHRDCQPPRRQGAEQPQRHRREVGRRHLFHRPDLRPQRVLRQSAPAAAATSAASTGPSRTAASSRCWRTISASRTGSASRATRSSSSSTTPTASTSASSTCSPTGRSRTAGSGRRRQAKGRARRTE